MTKPIQPGEKITISSKKTDTLALAWLNSQPNRSEAIMELIRERALRELAPAAPRAVPVVRAESRPVVPPAPPRPVAKPVVEEDGFAGMSDFFAGMNEIKV